MGLWKTVQNRMNWSSQNHCSPVVLIPVWGEALPGIFRVTLKWTSGQLFGHTHPNNVGAVHIDTAIRLVGIDAPRKKNEVFQ